MSSAGCHLLVLLKRLCSEQCGPRSNCSSRIKMQQMTSADDIFICIFFVAEGLIQRGNKNSFRVGPGR